MRSTGERPRVFLQERQKSGMIAMINTILAAATSKVTIPDPVAPLFKFFIPAAVVIGVLSVLAELVRPAKGRRRSGNAGRTQVRNERGSRKGGVPLGFRGIVLGVMIIVCSCLFLAGASKVWAILFGAMVIVSGVFLLNLSKIKGKIGEHAVCRRMEIGLPPEEYTILNDLYLPVGDEGTTQIDHVVVSRYGVFVIETKNYTGWIFASADAKVWTQTIYKEKNTFQNPLHQNYRHICAISDNLNVPKEAMTGIVAFTGDCEFKTEMPENVVFSRQLADYIRSFGEERIVPEDVREIISALKSWDASVTPERRRHHVANLRERHGA